MAYKSGRHFLQIPGPSTVPDRILRAIDRQTIDHRGPEFGRLGKAVLAGMQRVFGTTGQVVIFPASGTGAWEAAIVNTLSHGDRVLMYETGQFASLWRAMAVRLGLEVEFVSGDWRHGVDPADVEARAARRHGPGDQGRHGRPQRDLDWRDQPDSGGARRHRPRRPSRPVHGRYDLRPWGDGLPA